MTLLLEKEATTASIFYFLEIILRAIHTPFAPACAQPLVIPAPSPPTNNPLTAVSKYLSHFGRAL